MRYAAPSHRTSVRLRAQGIQMISFEMMQPREYFSSHGWAVSKQGNTSPTVYYSDLARWYHYTPTHEIADPAMESAISAIHLGQVAATMRPRRSPARCRRPARYWPRYRRPFAS